VVTWKDGGPAEIPIPDDDPQSLGSIGPSGDFYDYVESLEGTATTAELQAEIKAIYLVGIINYETVFAQNFRTTNFRFFIGGDAGCEGKEMFADLEGNDAT
jgi:hypothetical protein